MRTFIPKKEEIERKWYVVDAQGQTLGRLASQIATVLRGKHKPMFTPHLDTGDFVIVINAEKIVLTGNKLQDKYYHRHSGYAGGLKSIAYGDLMEKRPEKAVELAVKGMLPKNRLGRKLLTKLKIYRGAEHPHAAQLPEELTFND